MRILAISCTLFLVVLCGTARSGEGVFSEGDLVQLSFAPYIYHYNHGRNYNASPWYTGLEWESAKRWELGAAYFSNSYNQPCGYVYGGKRFIAGSPDNHLFLKITAGAILGYVHPYESKIPVNKDGIGLGIIPAVGYKYKRVTTQIAVLSMSGLMVNFGYDIWK
ncbi:MAG: hypothetical protein A2076_17285 [Geobacteraceae bacterium GWC2_53_11]|nr:MAG: hypothetical protein A2076_17285 [Geobacteraceae bacterium GWC2_53_11]